MCRMFADARLDLPGAQREKLTAFLAHFPGFADQANFDVKVNEVFDRWVGDATQGKLTYTGSVKPWFSGQVAIGVLKFPQASASLPTTDVGVSAQDSFHAVIGFGVKDRSRLDATIASVRALAGAGGGATFSDENYNGTTLVTVETSNGTGIYAVTDTVFLLAPNASDLKQSIDLLAAPAGSLAKDPGFSQQIAQLPADRLGTMYIGTSFFSTVMAQAQSPSNPLANCGNPTVLANASEVGALVVQGDNVSLDFRVTATGTPGARLTGTDDLAAWMPADTQAYLAVPGIGKAAHDLISCLKPQLTAAMLSATQLQQVETALGSKLEDYLNFVGDVAVGGSYDGTKVHVGLVANLTDETVATARVHELIGLIRIGASAGGIPITVTDKKVGDVTVTTIDFSKMHRSACRPAGGHVHQPRGRQRPLLPGHRRFRGERRVPPEGRLARRHRAVCLDAARGRNRRLGRRVPGRRRAQGRHRRRHARRQQLHDQYQAVSGPAGPPRARLYAAGRRRFGTPPAVREVICAPRSAERTARPKPGGPFARGSSNPSHPRRCDQAAHLSLRRRRQPERPGRSIPRHPRPLQPAHGSDRDPRGRGEGPEVAEAGGHAL